MDAPIYLDHNATTPVDARVLEAMLPYLKDVFGNPSSAHPYGWDAKGALEEARECVASLLGCEPDEILFTSGGTESSNLAICGVCASGSTPGRIVTSTIEHPATNAPLEHLAQRGWEIIKAPVDSQGVLDAAAAQEALNPRTALFTVMHANNETGAIQPVKEISDVAKNAGVLVHVDAAQSAGKIPVRVDDLGADLLTLAGHKLYAPKGIGALYVRRGVKLQPLLLGAGQEEGRRPGTQNIAGAVGLGTACRIANIGLEASGRKIAALRDQLHQRLLDGIPDLRLNGHPIRRLPNTLNVLFPGVSGPALLRKCAPVAASTGAACHEGGEETPSGVLTAMGIDPRTALGAVRLTLGRTTTTDQIAAAAAALLQAYASLGGDFS